jgi:hypothetical protein
VVVLTEGAAMARALSEHVAPVPADRTSSDAITPRNPLPPPAGDGDGRAPDEYVHPGMRVALWVWLLGFSALFLQVLSEGCIELVRTLLHAR